MHICEHYIKNAYTLTNLFPLELEATMQVFTNVERFLSTGQLS